MSSNLVHNHGVLGDLGYVSDGYRPLKEDMQASRTGITSVMMVTDLDLLEENRQASKKKGMSVIVNTNIDLQ